MAYPSGAFHHTARKYLECKRKLSKSCWVVGGLLLVEICLKIENIACHVSILILYYDIYY
jgi:hypothetical protein